MMLERQLSIFAARMFLERQLIICSPLVSVGLLERQLSIFAARLWCHVILSWWSEDVCLIPLTSEL